MPKLQTQVHHLRHTAINVNGTSYDIDGDGIVEVDDEGDVARLLACGNEWTTKIGEPIRKAMARMPVAGQPLRTAVDFVALLATDKDLAAQVGKLSSFFSVSALARRLGFKFTENELEAATSAQRARISKDEKKAAKSAKEAKVAKSGKGAKPSKEAPAKNAKDKGKKDKVEMGPDGLPVNLPEEVSGEWPDPDDTMSEQYLRRMASAYKASYDATTPKEVLIERIQSKMYEDGTQT